MKSLTIWGEEENQNAHINEIIQGRKKAFCTPEIWYGNIEGEPETFKGDRLILKDPSGKDRVLIEITKIIHLPFGEADESLAKAVLDCDLQDFRDAHRFYWEEDLHEDNIILDDKFLIVTEYFTILEIY